MMKKIAQNSTYFGKKTLPFSEKGLKTNEVAMLLDEDFPTLDLPKGVYVLPPHALDPSLGKRKESILA